MAQLTTVLPTDHLERAEGAVTRSTMVYDGYTGVEFRNKQWGTSRQVWTLSYKGYLTELQPVLDLFEAAEGMHKSFRFQPPGYVEGDFRFASDEIKPSYEATTAPGEYIASFTITVIQVLGE